MARIRWTPKAAEDIEAIAEYIASDSEYYARIFVTKVISAISRLQQFPEKGRVVPEADSPSIREIILGNYRIVYRLNGDCRGHYDLSRFTLARPNFT